MMNQKKLVSHTVFFQFGEHISDEQIEYFFQEMTKLKTENKVNGIVSFSYGKHNSKEGLDQGFNYGMTLVFENVDARDAYLPHPEHEKVKNIVIPLLKNGFNSVIALDWLLDDKTTL